MLIEDVAIREYLRPVGDSFWEWREDGGVVTWKDGKTIAFRSEAADVLAELASEGLPPFSALLLLIAATRQSWASDGSEAGILAAILRDGGDEGKRMELLADVLAGLDRVHSLDADLVTPVPAKTALAEIVFERSQRVAQPEQAEAIANAMRHGLSELLEPPEVDVVSRGYAPALLLRDLHLLQIGLRRVQADAVRLRMTTGLMSLPKAAEVAMPAWSAAANLIKALSEETELGGLGRVARRLLPSAALPRRLSAEREQEFGGYSDIANRGSLDRLLTSELAHDNLTLAVRVAMNEALYLRRESPPSKPQHHRMVLIDVGIRTWGVPRVFAMAAALALAATLPRLGSITYFRARTSKLQPAEVLTRAGIIGHLESLEPDLNVAEAIPPFLAQVEQSTDPVEPVLVTTEDGLADAAVQTALRHAAFAHLFVATVSRQGRFRIYGRRLRGVKLLHEATLDLSELVEDSQELVAPAPAADLPAIFGVRPFPLFLSHHTQADSAWYVDRLGVLSVTKDRRLLLWSGGRGGAMQVTDRLPRGKVWWLSPTVEQDSVSLVIGSSEKLQLVEVDRNGRRVDCLQLHAGPASQVCEHQGVLFVIGRRETWVVSKETGGVVETVTPPEFWQRQGRFFKSTTGVWQALTYDGQAARFDAAPALGSHRPKLIACFDQVGADGPIGVDELGCLHCTATNRVTRVEHGLKGRVRVLWVSPDGWRLKLGQNFAEPGKTGVVMVDAKNGTATPCPADGLDDRVQAALFTSPLRHRFLAAAVTDFGNLAIQSQRGQWLVFCVQNGLPLLSVQESASAFRQIQKFEQLESEFGYKLSLARWSEGSQCMLDSRGLLHLRSSDRRVPEATIVLSEGQLSGWSSDGRVWGKSCYVGDGPRVLSTAREQVKAFENTVQQFAACIHA
jgi:hypothetical protein